jgi:hypothetical protein
MTGVERIARERNRQIFEEGWDGPHDDEHVNGELAAAAHAYLLEVLDADGIFSWPWDVSWWKPSDDPIRNLEKAGALIAAEIDRLSRAAR